MPNWKMKCSQFPLVAAMLFPISTVVEKYIGFMNKLLLGGLCLTLLLFVIQKGRTGGRLLLYLMFLALTYGISFIITPMEALKINPNMAVYYLVVIFYFLYFVLNKEGLFEDLARLRGFIFFIVLVFTVILVVTIFLPNAYMKIEAGGWGDERYFASFSNSPNRVGPACLFIMIMITWLIVCGYRKYLAFLCTPPLVYASLMGGSRTYLVLVCAAWVVCFYHFVTKKRYFWLSLIPIGLIGLILISKSNMMTKIQISLSWYGKGNDREFWRRLSNSRSVIWAERLAAYRDFSVFHKIFGKGINYTSHTFGLWSHNDFIEIICSYGIIGLLNYLIIVFLTIRTLLDRQVSLMIRFIVVFIWFFNAMFNFFYCYFNAVLGYPILLMAVSAPYYQKLTASKRRSK